MKKIIIELGKKYNLKLEVFFTRIGFDVLGYELNCEGRHIWADTYYTGKTSTGVLYPSNKNEFLIEVKKRIKDFNKNK
jgi:hypothetical protein